MIEDGTYIAVVDRFEDDTAVLLLEQDGDTVDELLLPKTQLPEGGTHVDAVVTVTIADGTVNDITYEPDETAARSTRAQRRFDDLSERPPSREDESD
ncbi:DUF3006 domain-containing protein [Halopenitus salinus]|uniref:DUF3006 domain-containing protein n=1 Tax=Halopenitus salinus TaxID=1198295 RepID=A0ABD5UTT6_9EURY